MTATQTEGCMDTNDNGPEQQHAREAAFHNALAHSLDADFAFEPAFTAPTAMENRFIVSDMGDLRGKRVLDLGCGSGDAALYFASRGAESCCCDISQGMTDLVRKRAGMNNLTLHAETCGAESLSFPDNHFDYVYAHGVLHHVADRQLAYRDIRRVLKPGGAVYAVEPLKGNPAIWIYRLMATKMRSDDEAPLSVGEVKNLARHFTDCRAQSFWLMTQSLFIKYYLVDRVHPNDSPYWKMIFAETDASLRWWKPLQAIDKVLTRLPLLRRWAYTMVLSGRKPSDGGQ